MLLRLNLNMRCNRRIAVCDVAGHVLILVNSVFAGFVLEN